MVEIFKVASVPTFSDWKEIADHDPAEQMEGHMAQQMDPCS
jgi:hypothetical protein